MVSGGPQDQGIHRTLDLTIGESAETELPGGTRARLKFLDLQETLDDVNGSVRRAEAKIEVNGEAATLVSATYHLPRLVGGVQIDCPITKGCLAKAKKNVWGLRKDARFRIWPAGSPWIAPGTFV